GVRSGPGRAAARPHGPDPGHRRRARCLGHPRDRRVPRRALSGCGHLAGRRRPAGARPQPLRRDAFELLRTALADADEHLGVAAGQGPGRRGRSRHRTGLRPARGGPRRRQSRRPVPVRALLRGRRLLCAGAHAPAHLRRRTAGRPRSVGRGHAGAAGDARLDRRCARRGTLPRQRRTLPRSADRRRMKIYRVGGAVRGRPSGGGAVPVALHPRAPGAYALARPEGKTARGYRGFAFSCSPDVTLEDDLARRDLTINAIAQADDDSLVDPFGGQRDIEARVLRHVGEAFAEDPVRILRLARFAARFPEFSIAGETMALMRAMVESGEVDALVPERSWQEISRGLMTARPSRMFATLRECGALARILPKLDG